MYDYVALMLPLCVFVCMYACMCVCMYVRACVCVRDGGVVELVSTFQHWKFLTNFFK
jgi:hypothetical protein